MKIKLWILVLYISGLVCPGMIVKAAERIQIDGCVKYNVSPTVSKSLEGIPW